MTTNNSDNISHTEARCSLIVCCTEPSGKIRIISTQSDLGGEKRDVAGSPGAGFAKNIELKLGIVGSIGGCPVIPNIGIDQGLKSLGSNGSCMNGTDGGATLS